MMIRKFSSWMRLLAVGMLLLAGTQQASAQTANLDIPDWQFFAPAELPEFDQVPVPNTGWYATYDRVVVYAQRPDTFRSSAGHNQNSGGIQTPNLPGQPDVFAAPNINFAQSAQFDRGWGNKYDIGFMSESGAGWHFNHTHLDGPNATDIVITERLNRIRSSFDADTEPQQDSNARVTRRVGQRDYEVVSNINVLDVSNWEINRVYRFTPNNAGWTVEPMLGVRFMKLLDFYRNDRYYRIDSAGNILPDSPVSDHEGERLESDLAAFENLGIGGQIGARFWRKYGRINYTFEFRAFGLHNQQDFAFHTDVITTEGATGNDAAVISEIIRRENAIRVQRSEFLFGGDFRAEAAFEITRDIAIRGGFHLTNIEKGVGRGANPDANSQDLLWYGWTFGLTVNR